MEQALKPRMTTLQGTNIFHLWKIQKKSSSQNPGRLYVQFLGRVVPEFRTFLLILRIHLWSFIVAIHRVSLAGCSTVATAWHEVILWEVLAALAALSFLGVYTSYIITVYTRDAKSTYDDTLSRTRFWECLKKLCKKTRGYTHIVSTAALDFLHQG